VREGRAERAGGGGGGTMRDGNAATAAGLAPLRLSLHCIAGGCRWRCRNLLETV
jgi:hypothetical protein